jgi:hypothetical protein
MEAPARRPARGTGIDLNTGQVSRYVDALLFLQGRFGLVETGPVALRPCAGLGSSSSTAVTLPSSSARASFVGRFGSSTGPLGRSLSKGKIVDYTQDFRISPAASSPCPAAFSRQKLDEPRGLCESGDVAPRPARTIEGLEVALQALSFFRLSHDHGRLHGEGQLICTRSRRPPPPRPVENSAAFDER